MVVTLLKKKKKSGLDYTILVRSLWIGQSNTNPLNYPVKLLEDDLCKTKVQRCLIGCMIKNGPYMREMASKNSQQAL